MRNISVIGCTRPSARPISVGAPACIATSASPVQSTVTLARIASGPDLVSNTTPFTLPSPRTPLAKAWNRNCTPASSRRSSATSLNHSGSKGTTYPVASEGGIAPPTRTMRSSSFASTPATTGSPGPWSVGRSVVTPRFSGTCICVWNDISGITSAAVALPPRKP